MHPVPGNENFYLHFNAAKPNHRFWLPPDLYQFTVMCCLHRKCLFSLFLPWPRIPKCPPSVPNLRCRQLPVLHFTFLYSLPDFNTPITLNSRVTSFCDPGCNFWLQSLALLSSPGSFHLIPTSERLSGLLDFYFPLSFLTLHGSFSFGIQQCPQ